MSCANVGITRSVFVSFAYSIFFCQQNVEEKMFHNCKTCGEVESYDVARVFVSLLDVLYCIVLEDERAIPNEVFGRRKIAFLVLCTRGEKRFFCPSIV